MSRLRPIQGLLFDAGRPQLRSRGHERSEAAVIDAERRVRCVVAAELSGVEQALAAEPAR
jgi:hypothetical protein